MESITDIKYRGVVTLVEVPLSQESRRTDRNVVIFLVPHLKERFRRLKDSLIYDKYKV